MGPKLCDIPHEDYLLDEIEFGVRFRTDYGDLGRLKQTIMDNSLIHPIAVARNHEGAGYPVRLVAGGRRFKALIELTKEGKITGRVTCRVFDELDEHTIRSLELIENAQRKDMSFYDDAKLKSEIHRLEVLKHGPKLTRSPDDKGHSLADTAKILNVSKSHIEKDAALFKDMESLKDIINFDGMSRSECAKSVKQVVKQAKQKVGANKARKVIGENSDDRLLTLTNAYKIEDCTKGMLKIGVSTQSLVEIDPPYAIDLHKKKKGMDDPGYNEIDVRDYIPLMRKVFDESWRILKQDSWLLCWFGPEPWMEVMRYLIEGGTEESAFDLYDQISVRKQNHHAKPFVARFGSSRFRTHRMCGQWVKPSGQTQQPLSRLANSYESFFYAMKGNPELNKPGSINTFPIAPVPPEKKIHPTERPAELINKLLDMFVPAGSSITVPFAGSGRTLLEAAKLDMIPTGFDLTQAYKDGYTIALTKEIK